MSNLILNPADKGIETGTGFIRAREVRARFQGKIDPDLCHLLEAMAEHIHKTEKDMVVMAGAVEKMADIINNFTQVAENMKDEIIKMKGLADPHPEQGPVTQ